MMRPFEMAKYNDEQNNIILGKEYCCETDLAANKSRCGIESNKRISHNPLLGWSGC